MKKGSSHILVTPSWNTYCVFIGCAQQFMEWIANNPDKDPTTFGLDINKVAEFVTPYFNWKNRTVAPTDLIPHIHYLAYKCRLLIRRAEMSKQLGEDFFAFPKQGEDFAFGFFRNDKQLAQAILHEENKSVWQGIVALVAFQQEMGGPLNPETAYKMCGLTSSQFEKGTTLLKKGFTIMVEDDHLINIHLKIDKVNGQYKAKPHSLLQQPPVTCDDIQFTTAQAAPINNQSVPGDILEKLLNLAGVNKTIQAECSHHYDQLWKTLKPIVVDTAKTVVDGKRAELEEKKAKLYKQLQQVETEIQQLTHESQ